MAISARPTKIELTAENILSRVEEIDIFKKYSPNFMEVGRPFKSDLRKDKNPSCKIFQRRDGRYAFKDFTTGESYDCFDYLKARFPHLTFHEILELIDSDFNLGLSEFKMDKVHVVKAMLGPDMVPIVNQGRKKVEAIVTGFSQIDRDYWDKRYLITDSDLRIFGIKRLVRYFIAGIQKNCGLYATYLLDLGDGAYKMYAPLAPSEEKWRSNTMSHDIQGWYQLPAYGKLLIITSSLKDVIVLWKIGIPAIAMPSENTYPSEQLIRNLYRRFERIGVLLNNDFDKKENWGQIFAQEIIKRFPSMFNILIPTRFQSTDPSDFIEKHKDYPQLYNLICDQIETDTDPF